jgi:hypothetical protein
MWYFPEVARDERQYQMQCKAVELLIYINKMEKLLGHNLNITEDIVKRRVEEAIERQIKEFHLNRLGLDVSKVDWDRINRNACYRLPPFEAGDKEKGFRDALIVETFMQLVDVSPKTMNICRVVVVAPDRKLREAINSRIEGTKNVYILESNEELKGLINTLTAEVKEEYLNSIKEKVKIFFFNADKKEGLYYEQKIFEKIRTQFRDVLREIPKGADERRNGEWIIGAPTFVKKDGQRVSWATRIKIEANAYKQVANKIYFTSGTIPTTITYPDVSALNNLGITYTPNTTISGSIDLGSASTVSFNPQNWSTANIASSASSSIGNVTYDKELFAKGETVIQVLWSILVTTRKNFRTSKIEKIEHISTNWEQ